MAFLIKSGVGRSRIAGGRGLFWMGPTLRYSISWFRIGNEGKGSGFIAAEMV
jgi:hypothetical protein